MRQERDLFLSDMIGEHAPKWTGVFLPLQQPDVRRDTPAQFDLLLDGIDEFSEVVGSSTAPAGSWR